MSPAVATVGMAEAKTNFSKLTANANATGLPITVFKNNKPWVEIRPLATPRDDFEGMPTETIRAIRETEAMAVDPEHVTYHAADDLFAALGL
ncbi:MAG: hypothetical protein Q4B77_05415 [Coriobacteriaceae bacterium]|nr:hypothetical protein [Coriobacteriaceae bacterium]